MATKQDYLKAMRVAAEMGNLEAAKRMASAAASFDDNSLLDDVSEFGRRSLGSAVGLIAETPSGIASLFNDTMEDDEAAVIANRERRAAIAETLGYDPGYDQSGLATASDIAGSVGAFLAPAAAGAIAGIPGGPLGMLGGAAVGIGGSVLMGAGSNVAQSMEAAKRKVEQGGTLTDQEYDDFINNAAMIGASEGIPIGGTLARFARRIRKSALDDPKAYGAIRSAFRAAIEEGSQEALAGLANNANMQKYIDPDIGLTDSLGESFVIGAGVGGGLDLIFSGAAALKGRRVDRSIDPSPPKDEDEITDEELAVEEEVRRKEAESEAARREAMDKTVESGRRGPGFVGPTQTGPSATDSTIISEDLDVESMFDEVSRRDAYRMPVGRDFAVEQSNGRYFVSQDGTQYGPAMRDPGKAAELANRLTDRSRRRGREAELDFRLNESGINYSPEQRERIKGFFNSLRRSDAKSLSATDVNLATGTSGYANENAPMIETADGRRVVDDLTYEELIEYKVPRSQWTSAHKIDAKRVKSGAPRTPTYSVNELRSVNKGDLGELGAVMSGRATAQVVGARPTPNGFVIQTEEGVQVDENLYQTRGEAMARVKEINDRSLIGKRLPSLDETKDKQFGKQLEQLVNTTLRSKGIANDINSKEGRGLIKAIIGRTPTKDNAFQNLKPGEKQYLFEALRDTAEVQTPQQLEGQYIAEPVPIPDISTPAPDPDLVRRTRQREDLGDPASPAEVQMASLNEGGRGSQAEANRVRREAGRTARPPERAGDQVPEGQQIVEYDPEATDLAQKMRDMLKGFGLDSEFATRLVDQVGNARRDSAGNVYIVPTEPVDDGTVTAGSAQLGARVIQVSLDAVRGRVEAGMSYEDAVAQTMNHEVIHALRGLDLFTAAEWGLLERLSRKYKKPGTDKTYGAWAADMYSDQPAVLIQEEAIAEMLADAMTDGVIMDGGIKKPSGKPGSMIKKIIDFFKRMVGFAQENNIESYNDLVQKIQAGEVGSREVGRIRTLARSEARGKLVRPGLTPEAIRGQPEDAVEAPVRAAPTRGQRISDAPILDDTLMEQRSGAPILERSLLIPDAATKRAQQMINASGSSDWIGIGRALDLMGDDMPRLNERQRKALLEKHGEEVKFYSDRVDKRVSMGLEPRAAGRSLDRVLMAYELSEQAGPYNVAESYVSPRSLFPDNRRDTSLPAILKKLKEYNKQIREDEVKERREGMRVVYSDDSIEQRLVRAQEQGFDTNTIYYHGTPASDIKRFRGNMGMGTIAAHVTENPGLANQFAGDGTIAFGTQKDVIGDTPVAPNVMPLLIKRFAVNESSPRRDGSINVYDARTADEVYANQGIADLVEGNLDEAPEVRDQLVRYFTGELDRFDSLYGRIENPEELVGNKMVNFVRRYSAEIDYYKKTDRDAKSKSAAALLMAYKFHRRDARAALQDVEDNPSGVSYDELEVLAPYIKAAGYDGYLDYETGIAREHTAVALFNADDIKGLYAEFDPDNVPEGMEYGDDMMFQRRVVYEVAPDPNNKAAMARWNSLSYEDRKDISRSVSRDTIRKVSEILKVSGRVDNQVGNYIEEPVQESFALIMQRGDPGRVAKALGYILDQDSMVAAASKPFPGSFKSAAVQIDIGNKSVEEINDIFYTLRGLEGVPQISGQSTVGDKMIIFLDKEMDPEVMATAFDEALGGRYNVTIDDDVNVSFIDREGGYDYASAKEAREFGQTVGGRLDNLKHETARRLRRLIDERLRDEGRQGAGRAATSGLEGAITQDGKLRLTHFARSEFDTTDPSRAGTGLDRNTRLARVEATYFGITDADVNPYVKEQGLGDVELRFSIDPARVYDIGSDPEGLKVYTNWPAMDIDATIKAVNRKGYAGFWVDNKTLGKLAVINEPVTRDYDDTPLLQRSTGTPITKAVERAKKKYNNTRISTEEEFFGVFWPKMMKEVGGTLDPQKIRLGARRAMSDIEQWVKDNPKFNDYYTADRAATRSALEGRYGKLTEPEFDLYMAIAGLTSPGTKLKSNIGDAVQLFNLYQDRNSFEDIILGRSPKGNIVVAKSPVVISGATQPTKARSLKGVDMYIQKVGLAKAMDMLKEPVTKKELREFRRSMGYTSPVADIGATEALVLSATGQKELIPRAFVFGSKVGAYILNVMGDPMYTTVDVWESRFIRSYFDDMFATNTGIMETAAEADLFNRFSEEFSREFEKRMGYTAEPATLQAMRWFYMINAAREAGYRGASTNQTISELTEEQLNRYGIPNQRDRGRSNGYSDDASQQRFIPEEDLQRVVEENQAEADRATNYVPEFSVKASPEAQYIARNPDEALLPDEILESRQPSYTPEDRAAIDGVLGPRREKADPLKQYQEATGESSLSYLLTRAKQATVNRYARLETLYDKNFRGQLADVSAIASVLFADRSRGVVAAAIKYGVPQYKDGFTKVVDFTHNGKKYRGLVDVIGMLRTKKHGDLSELAQAYAVAIRGRRLNAEGKPTPVTRDDYNRIMASVETYTNAEGNNPIKEWHGAWQAYNNKVIEFLEATGVLNEETSQQWRESADYIPYYRTLDPSGDAPRVTKGIFGDMTTAGGFKAYKGSTAQLDVPLIEAIVKNTSAAIDMGMRNVAQQRIARDMQQIGLAKQVGINETVEDAPTVKLKVGGKIARFAIYDPLIFESMQAIDGAGIEGIARSVFGGPASLLRETVTRSPGFMIANLMRDTLSAWVTSGSSFIPVIDSVKGLASDMEKLERTGVVGGYDFSNDPAKLDKFFDKEIARRNSSGLTLNMFKLAWDALGSATTRSDAATRNAVFKDVYARTGNEAEAHFQSMEVLNFSRRGSNPVVRAITASIPFLNARIQGLDVLYRGATGRNTASRDISKGRATASFLMRGSLIALSTAIYWAMVSDEEEYREQSREVRDNNWLIPVGGGQMVKLPIPFEVGLIFKTIPETVLDVTFGERTDREALATVQSGITDTLAIDPIFGIQAIAPILEASINYNSYTGRPIEPVWMNNLLPEQRSTFRTTEVAMGVSDLFKGVPIAGNPMKVDHILRGYFGTIGGYVLDVTDRIIRDPKVGGDPDRAMPNMASYELPVMRRFLTSPEGSGLKEQFYDLYADVRQTYNTIREMKEQGRQKELDYYLMTRGKLLEIKEGTYSLKRQLDKARQKKNAILQSNLTPEQKRELIDQIDSDVNRLLKVVPVLEAAADRPALRILE